MWRAKQFALYKSSRAPRIYEYLVKVFNSSVENRVEKHGAGFKNIGYICVSCSLHNFWCR